MNKNIYIGWLSSVLCLILPSTHGFIEEKPLVVVITSYNNKNWYQRNLDSVFSQKYHNYRVIYIDDASPDGTGELVEQYIQEKHQEERVVLLRNTSWESQMANHYKAVHRCDDNEIIVQLDGDDWFAHPHVLELVNTIYSTHTLDTWITYGGGVFWPSGEVFLKPESTGLIAQLKIKNNDLRSRPFLYGHLRTFYAWLFKKLKLEDLMITSSFYPMTPGPDGAFMRPMLEMAGWRHSYQIDQPVYIWNMLNPLSQIRINSAGQYTLGDLIDSWPKYPSLSSDEQIIKSYERNKVSYVLFVSDTTASLLAMCLKSLHARAQGIGRIIGIYGSNTHKADAYSMLVHQFPRLKLMRHSPAMGKSFSLFLHDILKNLPEEHVVLALPTVGVAQTCNLTYCIQELERTYAYGFYLTRNESPALVYAPLSDRLRAWHLAAGSNVWRYPNSLGAVLYRKKDIIKKLRYMHCSSLSEFLISWSHQSCTEKTLGLFFKESPMKDIKGRT